MQLLSLGGSAHCLWLYLVNSPHSLFLQLLAVSTAFLASLSLLHTLPLKGIPLSLPGLLQNLGGSLPDPIKRILSACKTSTMWRMMKSVTSLSRSLVSLDHACRGLQVPGWLNSAKGIAIPWGEFPRWFFLSQVIRSFLFKAIFQFCASEAMNGQSY